jgi:hypothetical protein
MHSELVLPAELFVKLHPQGCVRDGFAGTAAWDSPRRSCDVGAGPVIGIVVDTHQWLDLGSPRSEEAFREALGAGPEAR